MAHQTMTIANVSNIKPRRNKKKFFTLTGLTLIDVAAKLLKKLRNQKRRMPSILEIICLFRVYLVFLLLALESTQDADPAKNGSKS